MPTCKQDTEPLGGPFPSAEPTPLPLADLLPLARQARRWKEAPPVTDPLAPTPKLDRPSERVLARLVALGEAEGFVLRTFEEEEDAGPNAPTGFGFNEKECTRGRVLNVAWSLGLCLAMTDHEIRGPSREDEQEGLARVWPFATALVAALYADEARRLVP